MTHGRHCDAHNRLLKVMPPEDFARLRPHLEPVDLLTGQILLAPNARTEHIHFIETGIASITAEGANGRVEVGIIGREGAVGITPVLLGSDRIPHNHFIQMPGSALQIRTDALTAAVEESPTLRKLLLRYVLTEMIQVRQTAFINATHEIEARLARWLLMCHDRVDGDEILLKHDFLSMMLGVRRSGVTLAMQQLEGAGRIRARRGRITVVNRELLEEMADGGYGTPEAEYARLIEGA
ncbi:CarD family transcriptional regulator [Methylobacterium sp. Leaf102]|jgi:CRP-like cAMP-binding protein|uniref:Crp/Fnr family transcriptional regulator n=1 Tax=unclassified Methylobacterium TaxID=2615210 RepID=UPI0006F46B8D|nr:MULTISPECIES: Crp/Fnr family transcriptional regulator [unclassified Methylobacterium]KQO55891.1 CarD family transcriptional regulator [Methylobacterium sp. Leaf87]KQP28194.1 CarD family transcriptional regulator [Methylobacterium sp. Leaf102]KQP58414.1 CarD family transcriptional regulator [Methylobacterium sp. Leaf112]USU30089.1 Crp/Fnr family transcriptional regulator [Methylobacterium sp. OTU13CASTA1]